MVAITTVILTYKRPNLLKTAIRTAQQQTFSNIQICVYDNNSGDETRQVVEEIAKFDSRVKYFCHAETIDAPANFQHGLDRVNSPFFSILADDDFLAPTFYETALCSFDRYPNAKAILGSTIDCSPSGKVISAEAMRWSKEYFEPPFGVCEIVQKYFNWTGTLFRKEVLDHIRIDPTVKPIDYDFILRLAAKFPFAISKTPCALFIIHPQSYSSFSGLKLFWPSWQTIMNNMNQALQNTPVQQEVQRLLQKRLQNNLHRLSLHQMAEKKFDAAEATLGISDVKILKKMCAFLRIYPYLTRLIELGLKMARYRRISAHLKFRQLTKRLIENNNLL